MIFQWHLSLPGVARVTCVPGQGAQSRTHPDSFLAQKEAAKYGIPTLAFPFSSISLLSHTLRYSGFTLALLKDHMDAKD